MGRIVMRESIDSDFYVEWSSVVEAPTFWGTRAEMLAHISSDSDPWLRDDAPHHPDRRMERCDATGTSSLWVETAGMRDAFPEDGAWDDEGRIYQQQGVLDRADVFVAARRLGDGDGDVSDLLRPFDDAPESEESR